MVPNPPCPPSLWSAPRRLRPSFRLPLVLAFLALAASGARAHEYWLAPSTYRPALSDTITIRAFVGTGFRGESRPFAAPRTVRFRLEGAKSVNLAPHALNGAIEWARLRPTDTRGAVVSYESNFVPIELSAREFERYLELEGLDAARAERARTGQRGRPGRERYRRACKAWLSGNGSGEESGGGSSESARVTRALGLSLEIVPLTDPVLAGPLRVRVLFEGRPLGGALVRGWRQPLDSAGRPRFAAARDSVGPSVEARTNASGEAPLAVSDEGEWLLSAVHMVPSRSPDEADWESTWASLTFARAPTSGRRTL